MLSLKYRLKKETDIKKVFSNKQSVFGKAVIINFAKNELKNSRFTFVVSTKTFKKAVTRNHFKRVLRSIVRDILPSLPIGFDFVVVIKTNIQNMLFEDIKSECQYLFNKIK
jgi:ribonuclease P protein component